MPRPTLTSAKPIRARVGLPGVLADVVRQRWAEFGYPGFSPFSLELICFDLRLRVPHEITRRIAKEPARVQGAVDRALARYFHTGAERDGLIVQAAHGQWRVPNHPPPRGDFVKFRDHVRYSETLAPCIDQRWPEAGYETFSDYVTGVLRYDLLLLGPHRLFNGDDKDPVILESLDRGTRREFEANVQPKRIYLDRLLEEVAGRPLSQEDLRTRKVELAELIIEHALRLDRDALRAG